MKFYTAPGSCSLGIHVLLEEIGKPYDLVTVNLKDGEQQKPEYTRINPKAKVPALERDDGAVLTEWPAIAVWLALTNPEKHMLPPDPDGMARALEVTDYIVSTVHMQGFTRIARPANFTPNAADIEAVQARGREIFEKGIAILDQALADKEYVVSAFSIADAALFYVEYWAVARLGMELPANIASHYARMPARPAVQGVVAGLG
jgi:glutathione S-transferase